MPQSQSTHSCRIGSCYGIGNPFFSKEFFWVKNIRNVLNMPNSKEQVSQKCTQNSNTILRCPGHIYYLQNINMHPSLTLTTCILQYSHKKIIICCHNTVGVITEVSLQSWWNALAAHHSFPDNKVHGANMGPPGSCRPQMGPMLAPWTLLWGLWLCSRHTWQTLSTAV